MGYAAPPPHKRFDNRFRQPNTHRSLIQHSDLQIVGSVTWYAAIFLGWWGGILKHQISAFSYRVKTLNNHIFLLNQANGLVFGRHVLIHKSYNLRCILRFFCVAMVAVYKETLSMGSNVNNNGCFDFRDKYTLPMYLECAYN